MPFLAPSYMFWPKMNICQLKVYVNISNFIKKLIDWWFFNNNKQNSIDLVMKDSSQLKQSQTFNFI
jgi:hypothetical protein